MMANISTTPSGYNSPLNWYKVILLIILLIVLFTIIPPKQRENFPIPSQSEDFSVENSTSNLDQGNRVAAVNPDHDSISMRLESKKCDMLRGRWVPYPEGPLYTNQTTGCYIEKTQNCMRFGRPDTEFMKWRWKPDGCDLPVFDAARFLELVRGKSMAFVGDSVARNQLQSLKCLLSTVARPINESSTKVWTLRRFVFTHYNFTLELFGSTHLVRAEGIKPHSAAPIDLYLDEADHAWASKVANFDYVIISAGHWFSRPKVRYHESHKVVGCSMCNAKNMTDLTRFYGYKKAFETTFRTLIDLPKFNGTVILRTISPTHFEPEYWEGIGYCVRRKPFSKQQVRYDWFLQMYKKIQMEEFLAAKREGEERGLKFRLLDITEVMLLRPDGHPNHYGHPPGLKNKLSDCLHWCLPGPIDVWNEFLLQMLKNENGGSREGL
ncbi:hypothetical protein RHGRI_006240 [Rhododendron griersonianum]|uniref:Trichome birefringence-like N-terminal domain-containing protein n=1 Tax=Rhododendron griersonianum TaxID=479676 RepID=A0AAV6KST0_9ERIC|nr:hypothetical protein RHGRI_006240 [Rhododendron griersonianum]